MHRNSLQYLLICVCLVGCDVPYKKEYDQAMELKALAEEKAAQAEAAAARAQKALDTERNAIKRLYTED